MEEIFAGVMVADALQRQNTESALNDMKRKGLESDLDNLRRDNQEREAIRRIQNSFSEAEKQRDRDRLNSVKDAHLRTAGELRRTEQKLEFHRNLIATNPATVADYSPEFKKKYMEECDNLSHWVGSQLGYRDLAMTLGAQLGYTSHQIVQMSKLRSIELLKEKAKKYTESTQIPSDYNIYNESRIQRVLVEFEPLPHYDEFVAAGRLYDFPDLKIESWEQAFELWMGLALSGNAQAQYNVGRCFDRGEGIEEDTEKALEWYKKAFEQNDPKSAYNLYLHFKDKNSNHYNVQTARYYAKAAIDRGEPRATPSCEEFEKNLQKQEQEARDKAHAEWCEKATVELLDIVSKVNICTISPEIQSAFVTATKENFKWLKSMQAIHACKIETLTTNIRDVGGLFSKELRGDCYLKITNPTEEKLIVKIANVNIDGWTKQNFFTHIEAGRCELLPLATLRLGTIIPDIQLILDYEYNVNLVLEGSLHA